MLKSVILAASILAATALKHEGVVHDSATTVTTTPALRESINELTKIKFVSQQEVYSTEGTKEYFFK